MSLSYITLTQSGKIVNIKRIVNYRRSQFILTSILLPELFRTGLIQYGVVNTPTPSHLRTPGAVNFPELKIVSSKLGGG